MFENLPVEEVIHEVDERNCPECGNDESKDALLPDIEKQVICKAGVAEPMIPHSFCSPELLVHILYVQAVPLNRQEKEFKSLSAEISRTPWQTG